MNKIQYQHPAMCVVEMTSQAQLLSGSITGVNGGDTDIGFGGGAGGPARTPQFNWDN